MTTLNITFESKAVKNYDNSGAHEAAKLIMIFWCIFVFMICGFEHSIANMSVLAVGLMNAGDASVSIGGYIYNVGLVTLGNMIGGAIFVALPYYITAKEPKK